MQQGRHHGCSRHQHTQDRSEVQNRWIAPLHHTGSVDRVHSHGYSIPPDRQGRDQVPCHMPELLLHNDLYWGAHPPGSSSLTDPPHILQWRELRRVERLQSSFSWVNDLAETGILLMISSYTKSDAHIPFPHSPADISITSSFPIGELQMKYSSSREPSSS